MAEIDSGGGGKKKGKGGVRSKKSSTKVDMTPMVDLAFLLITFFMLTTTLSKPQAKQLIMPDDQGDSKPMDDDNVITIVVGENDKLYYYTGAKKPQVSTTDYSEEGIRHVINKKHKERGEKLMVVIKAMDKAKYRNVVDILDEMVLTNTKSYAIVKITPQDLELVKMEDAHAASEGH